MARGVEWGGYGGVSYGQGFTSITGWPGTWGNPISGNATWTTSVDLSALGLTGTGEWEVWVGNGYVSNLNEVVYDIEMVVSHLVRGVHRLHGPWGLQL